LKFFKKNIKKKKKKNSQFSVFIFQLFSISPIN
jgi:hypothetical protein